MFLGATGAQKSTKRVRSMITPVETVGMDPKGLDRVKALFQEQLDQGLHPGAAMAAYRNGKLVLDLYGGLADREAKKPVSQDTLFVIFSSTKPLAAFCWHLLWARGQLEMGDWIADHWPEFAKNGKDRVTVRHILTHTAGFPETPPELTPDKMTNWEASVQAMENATLSYEPGKVIAYHSLNFGWVVGEVVRRVDGRPISRFLQEEVTGPLGMKDFYLGLPPEQEPRVAKLYAMEDCDSSDTVDLFNRSEAHQAVIPAANGISTARDLARFYAMLSMGGSLDGTEIVRPGVIKSFAALQEEGEDRTNGREIKLGLGFAIDDPGMGTQRGSGRYNHSIGHGGLGSSIGWVDLGSRLAVAIITNGVRGDESNTQRMIALSEAVRDACL